MFVGLEKFLLKLVVISDKSRRDRVSFSRESRRKDFQEKKT